MDRDLLPGMVNTPLGPMHVGAGAVGDTTLICGGEKVTVQDPPSYGWVWGLFGLVLGVAGLAGAQMYGYAPAMRKRNPTRRRAPQSVTNTRDVRGRIRRAYQDFFREEPRSINFYNGQWWVEANELDIGGWPYKYAVVDKDPGISDTGLDFKGV